MKTPRRQITIKTIIKIPIFMWYCFKCFFIFKRPLSIIFGFITGKSPSNKQIKLLNGFTIYLSDDDHDINTVFLVFAKKEYGIISPNSVVVDIGANIGIFSLYAIYMGSQKVYAYEPCAESYRYLLRNISENKLSNLIIPNRLAVTSGKTNVVKFLIKSSAQNHILEQDYNGAGDWELVKTINLDCIVDNCRDEQINLIKLDCQGTEYEILFCAGSHVFSKIDCFKMEYHNGRSNEIISFLNNKDYRLAHHKIDNSCLGTMWFYK